MVLGGFCRIQGGFSALHIAAEEGHVHLTSLLLQRGAPANCQSNNGLAPLHLAAQEDNLPVARTLVETGRARVDATTKVSRRPPVVAFKRYGG